MPIATQGDTVKVQYKALIEDDLLFDTSSTSPLEFTLGEKQTISAFEDAVLGMSNGESKTIHLQAKDAFGPYLEDLITTVSRNELPSHIDYSVGQQFQMQQSDGTTNLVKVIAANDKTVIFDANHTLAGKDLTFQISLQEVLKKNI